MFDTIATAPQDQLFFLKQAFDREKNPKKVDLLMGVYRDTAGNVPILKSVQLAEAELLSEEKTKNYLDIAGHEGFRSIVPALLGLRNASTTVIQTPGGTAAIRLVAEFLHQFSPTTTVWICNPTWINHHTIFQASQVAICEYSYYNSTTTLIPFDLLLSQLKNAKPGDCLLLHACCHNPTGCDFSHGQWGHILALVKQLSLIPLFDIAYQGFADGFSEDAYPLRLFAEHGVSFFVASSYSKNFGLYNERIGALTIVSDTKASIDNIFENIKYLARGIYSNPPAHPAKIIHKILSTELKKQWETDLLEMHARIKKIRRTFSQLLSKKISKDCSYIEEQNGLFSCLDIQFASMLKLREKFSIYLLNSGRINVTGINDGNVEYICDCIKSATA